MLLRTSAILLVALATATLHAQSTPATSLTFEVASLRPASPDHYEPGNLDLDPSDYNRYQGGPIIASGPLVNYLLFAYKVPDRAQAELIDKQLPSWASQRYTLRATVEGKPTKDQIRLMVQSLLAERFHLKLHQEPRQLPLYALVLDHQPAPGLTPTSVPDLCAKPFDQPKRALNSKAIQPSCQPVVINYGNLRNVRMSDYTIDQIAGNLVLTSSHALDPLPVVDRTGLTGHYDFNIEYLPPKKHTDTTPDEPGATFEEALKQQAGLKLLKQNGTIPVYVIDHVEPPSEN
jgi:uncharacterized protein (TIGR03435 family)